MILPCLDWVLLRSFENLLIRLSLTVFKIIKYQSVTCEILYIYRDNLKLYIIINVTKYYVYGIILMLISTILLSCRYVNVNVNGSYRGLYSYYYATKKEFPKLLVQTDTIKNICELVSEDRSKVYVVNGDQLMNCTKKYQFTLIYLWDINCKSGICYPLNFIQQQCDLNNIELFVVAQYYNGIPMGEDHFINRPIY